MRHSAAAANRFVDTLSEKCQILATQPEIKELRPDRSTTIQLHPLRSRNSQERIDRMNPETLAAYPEFIKKLAQHLTGETSVSGRFSNIALKLATIANEPELVTTESIRELIELLQVFLTERYPKWSEQDVENLTPRQIDFVLDLILEDLALKRR